VRFQHIEDEVLMNINRTIWLAEKNNANVNTNNIDKRLLGLFPVNIHCTIAWDTDDTCIDLHILEPHGVTCSYQTHITNIGGWSTPDYPGCTAYSTSMLREYMIKNAIPGVYKLGCNYYSNYRQDLTAGTTIWFTVSTNFATDQEVTTTTTLRLDVNSLSPNSSSHYEIGSVTYGVNPTVQSWINKWDPENSKPATGSTDNSKPATVSTDNSKPATGSTDNSKPVTVSTDNSKPATGFIDKVKKALHI